MNEELWLSGDDPIAMLRAVETRLSSRKGNFLAYGSARGLLVALPPEPFAEALDWWEWNWQRSKWNESHWEKHDDYRARCRAVWQGIRNYRIREFEKFPSVEESNFPRSDYSYADRQMQCVYIEAAFQTAQRGLSLWNSLPAELPLFMWLPRGLSRYNLNEFAHPEALVPMVLKVSKESAAIQRTASELDLQARRIRPSSTIMGVVRTTVRELHATLQTEVDDDSGYLDLLAAYAEMIREQFGNPYRACPFDPRWRTETVLRLAAGIERDRAFDRIPILADALIEAGCDNDPLLIHLTHPGEHQRGCWVLDRILDREPVFEPLVNVTGRHGRGHPPE